MMIDQAVVKKKMKCENLKLSALLPYRFNSIIKLYIFIRKKLHKFHNFVLSEF